MKPKLEISEDLIDRFGDYPATGDQFIGDCASQAVC